MERLEGGPYGLSRKRACARFKKNNSFGFLVSLTLLCIAIAPARALDPNQPPRSNFDLSHWYLGIPAAPNSITAAELMAGYTSSWFFTGPDGAMVFWAPVTGGTTPNSSYPRSELREQINPPDNSVNWPAPGTHILDAQCKVKVLPSTGKVIIGQIHSYSGEARPLLKLVFDNGMIDAQVKESPNEDADLHVSFPNVPFNSLITYRILFTDGLLSMTINGVTRSVNVYDNDPEWEDQTFYFKAGAYVQDNSGPSSEGGRVDFYQLSASHSSDASAPPLITKQPGSRGVQVSSNAVLNLSVVGGLPLAYQWQKNGETIAGATNSILPFFNAQLTDSGAYNAIITNASGTITSAVAVLTVVTNLGPISLADAVDNTNLVWTTSGSAPWEALYAVAPDGIDAARSGRIGDDGDTTLQTTVIGPGTVTFWWKVSSEADQDVLIFYIGSSAQAEISGNVDWQQRTFNVPVGSQVLKWTYFKSEAKAVAGDEGWVDQVRFGPQPPAITSQPVSRSVDAGATVTFNITATGAPPLSYQWWWDGVPLVNTGGVRGATTASLSLSNVEPAQTGNYWVVVSNAAESVTSSNALLIVTPVLALAEALDATNLVWTTNPPPAGPPWMGQPLVTQDGEDAARSGTIGHSQTTSFQTTVSGPGTLSFWWKASSETNRDYLIFYVGSSEQARISGEVNWQPRTFIIPSGSQILKWTYSKSSSGSVGQDRGWVDGVTFAPIPVVLTSQPLSQGVDAGATVMFNVTAIGTPPLSYQWQRDGTNLINGGGVNGATNPTLTLANVQLAQAGNYSVLVSNGVGNVTSSNALLIVTPILPLAVAVDAPTLPWTTNGPAGAGWVGQALVTHDDEDAARSGRINDDEETSLQTTVIGPGTVTFWWKVSSETNEDFLIFYIGSSEQAHISGEVDWQQRTFNIPAGSRVLRWAYAKGEEMASGADQGWIDEVQFRPQPPTITSQPASQNVDAGTTVNLSVVAAGAPPLFYQWQLEGTNLINGGTVRGATTATLTLSNVPLALAGTYSVIVSNAADSLRSSNAVLTVNPVTPLVDALETPASVWTMIGSPPWVGQTNVTRDGADAARSGAIRDSQTTAMQITVSGPGTICFWWKVSSEPSNDRLLFHIGSSERARITGEVDWQWLTFPVSSGSQILKWTYSKNSSRSAGQDRGWVDEVLYVRANVPTAPIIAVQPAGQTVEAQTTAVLSVKAVGSTPLSYFWQCNGTLLTNGGGVSGATTATLTLANVQPAQAGTYSVLVSNAVGSVTSSNALLGVIPVPALAEALDTSSLVWSTTGPPPWVGQTNVTYDGEDAARSGAVAHGKTTSMQTTVNGPGTLSFWWKVSCETNNNDRLRFYVNGSEQTRISGEVDWQQRTFNLSSGSQVLQWRYVKNSSVTVGQDRGWVDQVEFVPDIIAPAPFVTPSSPIVPQLTISGSEVVLTWQAEPGKAYRVSYKHNFSDVDWIILAGGVEGSDSAASIADNVDGPSQRFYQVTEE